MSADLAAARQATHIGPPQPLTGRQVRMYRGGFLLFLISESFLFVTLFAVRFLLVGMGRPAELSPLLATLATGLFLAGGVTAWLALGGVRAGDLGGMVWNAAATWVLGVAALAVVVVDAISSVGIGTRFGDIFQVTTWIHVGHILIGLIFLAAVWSAGRRARFSAENHWVVEAGVRFWWFVAATWAALYLVFYWL